MDNFFEDLKKYLSETEQSKVLDDWSKNAELDKIGITFENFLLTTTYYQSVVSIEPDSGYTNIVNNVNPEIYFGFFI